MNTRPRPVTIRGKEYPSQSEAARALGLTRGAIWHRVHPSWNASRRGGPLIFFAGRWAKRAEHARSARISYKSMKKIISWRTFRFRAAAHSTLHGDVPLRFDGKPLPTKPPRRDQ